MLENGRPLHSALCRSNRRSKTSPKREMRDVVGVVLHPCTKHKECFLVQTVHVWAHRVTLRMCEDSGRKDGDMLENGHLLLSAFCGSNRRSKPALQMQWLTPWELIFIHGQSAKEVFRSKLPMFGQEELPQACAKIVVKKTAIC